MICPSHASAPWHRIQDHPNWKREGSACGPTSEVPSGRWNPIKTEREGGRSPAPFTAAPPAPLRVARHAANPSHSPVCVLPRHVMAAIDQTILFPSRKTSWSIRKAYRNACGFPTGVSVCPFCQRYGPYDPGKGRRSSFSDVRFRLSPDLYPASFSSAAALSRA